MRNTRCSILPMLATVSLTLSAQAASPASDNAANAAYADGWQVGDNGGTGFQPWIFDYTGIAPTNHSDHFIDNAPLAGNSLGAPAFGMTDSGRPFFFDTSSSIRPFNGPLTVGQSFSVDVDGPGFANGDPNGFSKGAVVTLLNNVSGGASVSERFGVFTNNQFNNDNWAITAPSGTGSVDTGIPAGSSFHLLLTLTGAESYSVVLSPIGGGSPLFSQSGTLRTSTVGTLIDRVRFTDFGTGSAADGSSELFINNLSIVPEPATGAMLLLGLSSIILSRRSTK